MNRNFIQHAIAFGTETAQVTAKIDNAVIFTGAVTPGMPVRPTPPVTPPLVGDEIFSWQEDIAFEGTRSIEISVDSGSLFLLSITANLTNPFDPDQYIAFYSREYDGFQILDPLTNVAIDGVAQDVDPEREAFDLFGQWGYFLLPGSVLTATVNINPGIYFEAFDSAKAYSAWTPVRYDHKLYKSGPNGAPAGSSITDTNYWAPV
jgi:hypothetical protein